MSHETRAAGASSTRRAAFTLIELLVVIAIIAILAAILFPVFATARERARQAACLNNMKQVGIGVIQYTQDFDGVIPPAQVGPNSALLSWPTLIYPYVKSGGVFVCPSASEEPFRPNPQYVSAAGGATAWAGSGGSSATGSQTNRQYVGVTDTAAPSAFSNPSAGDGSTPALSQVPRLSYGRNLIPNTSSGDSPGWAAVNQITPGFQSATSPKSGFVAGRTTAEITEAEVPEPANTIHIVDAITGTTSGDPRSLGNSIRGIQQDVRTDLFRNDTASKVDYRHNGGFVALYGDGHAKWNKWGSTRPQSWTIQAD